MTSNQSVNPDTLAKVRKFAARNPQVFIGGQWTSPVSTETITVIDPSSGETIGAIAACDGSDIDQAVSAARTAFDKSNWRAMKPAIRRDLLLAIADEIERDLEFLSYLEAIDTGKNYQTVMNVDARSAIGSFRYFAGWCDKIHGTSNTLSSPAETHAFVAHEPVGVAALIVPWNFPLSLLAMKLAPALAAGCTAVVKPAEDTSLSALYFAEILQRAGLPEGVVNIVTGYGAEAGSVLSLHADVDKISFTGSTETGRRIIDASKTNFKRVSLELGGKAPNIVCHDADLERVITPSVMGAFFNSGQNCMALSRHIIHESLYDQYVDRFVNAANDLTLGGAFDDGVNIGPLVSEAHLSRVQNYAQIAREEGAEVVLGGERVDRPGVFFEPTIVAGAHADMRIAREEVFGPMVSIEPFADLDDVVRSVNQSPYGLSGAAWTDDLRTAHQLAKRLRVGNLGINSAVAADRDLPVGGYRQSGWGRENGYYAVSAYLEIKAVVIGID